MNKKIPLKSIVNSVSHEKGLSEEIIFDAIKEAILYAAKKKYKMLNIETYVDKNNGTYKTYAIYHIVENLKYNISIKDPFKNIPIKQAKKHDPKAEIGGKIKKEIKSIKFGRIDAQAARQIIIQKVKNAEKNIIFKDFEGKIGKLLSGVVRKVTKDYLTVDLGNNAEGIIKKKNLIPKDTFISGNKIKAYFSHIQKDEKNHELILNRSCNEMLIELLKTEVPEINEGLIEIKDVFREPGIRSKISLNTSDKNLDPIGACIGIRGSRIQNISNELCGEKIDIIIWNKDIITYIINIFSPIDINSIELDEKSHSMNIAISKDFLPKIIGKNGLNIKLINKLIKWNLNITAHEDLSKKFNAKSDIKTNFFMEKLNTNTTIVEKMNQKTLKSLDASTNVPHNEQKKTHTKPDIVNKIKKNAITNSLHEKNNLYKLKTLDLNIIKKLIKKNITNTKDLARLSTNDLVNITNIDENIAVKIIMEAKNEHFFKK